MVSECTQIESTLKKLLCNESIFPVAANDIHASTTLIELGIDSLKLVKLLLDIELTLSIKINLAIFLKDPINTFSDLLNAVRCSGIEKSAQTTEG